MDDRKFTADRLKSYLSSHARYYPGIWQQVDQLRAAKGKNFFWEDWCFLPLSAAYAIATQGKDIHDLHPILAQTLAMKIGVIGALYSWRPTQGIYGFHPDVFNAVWTTPLSGELPVELLYRLPEWCVYIETPGKIFINQPLFGFFAHLEDDYNKPGHHELRFVMDLGKDSALIPVGLHLESGTIPGAVESFLDEALQTFLKKPDLMDAIKADKEFFNHMSEEKDDLAKAMAEVITPIVSLTLYLCAVNCDMREANGGNRQPGRPSPVKTKKGVRLFPPERSTDWEVGYRIGAALKLAAQPSERGEGTEGTHASPAPHIRRAHWHSFWTGPKADSKRRHLDLKWLPPIPVGVKDTDQDIIPTFRDVR